MAPSTVGAVSMAWISGLRAVSASTGIELAAEDVAPAAEGVELAAGRGERTPSGAHGLDEPGASPCALVATAARADDPVAGRRSA